MMPMYMNTPQPGQMRPRGGCCYQGFGKYPQHMTTDASSPASCEHWPTPSPCYGNCVHGNFPAYTPYWPPSPCYPPQALYHQCWMNNSGYHPHAPPCYVHQPFSVGYHGFDSGKDVTGNNRCTKCSPKNGTGVVIEEHEPEIEKGDHREAVNHVRSSNCPYPIIWMPHENARNQEKGSHNQPPAQIQVPESAKVQKGDPKTWNGSFPFDENTLKSLIQNQGRNKTQNGKTMELPFDISKLKSLLRGREGQTQMGKEPEQIQYPIFWVPSQGEHEDVEASEKKECGDEGSDLKSLSSDHLNNGQNQDWSKTQNGKTVGLPFDISKLKSLLQGQGQTQKSNEPGQLQYPIFWVPSQGKQEDVEASDKKEHGNNGSDLKSASSDHSSNGQIAQCDKGNLEGVVSEAEKKSLVRNIPVESHKEPRNIPVKLSENHLQEPARSIVKTEPAEDTRKEQRASPPKASRLPPVCLRVDPLPKRKSGGSKSLSPPRRKEQTLTSEETKVTSPLSSKMVTRTVPESSNVKCEEANERKKASEERPSPTGTEKESVETKSSMQDVNCEIGKPCQAMENKEKPAKKTFSEEEAARIIQSRYRGYDVRRWEPIKKLKEIAAVREQMGDVRKRVQALELSADQHIEGKEMVVLGEMVMSLLLKLDSVQGLHHSIRDHRKTLARELSHMQENIDSLKKSSVEKVAVVEQVDDTSQTSDCPVNLEHSQLAEENEMVSDSNAEKVCPPSPKEQHLRSLKNPIDKQLMAEAEEVTGLSRTLATDPDPAAETGISEADSTTIPDKIETVEAVLPIDPSSADGSEVTVTNKEDKVMVKKLEELLPELPEVVETTLGSDNASEVSETVATSSENEDRKEDADYVIPSEKIEVFETVPPIKQSSADGNEMTMTNIDEDKVMVENLEEPMPELLQVMETDLGLHFKGLENATEVSETAANASKEEDGKGEDDYVLPSEKNKAVETVRLANSSSADADEMTVTSTDEDQVMVEKLHELPQVVETTHGQAFEGLENATEVSETVANASEAEDRKGDDDSILAPEKTEAAETIQSDNSLSVDVNEVTVTKTDEDKVIEKLEEPLHELPQVVETTLGSFEGPENATKVSETVVNASETEGRKGHDDSVMPSEIVVEFSELPVGVIDDKMQLLSQDSFSCASEAEKTVVDSETASKEDTNVDHSFDHFSDIGQETQVTEPGMSEETKKLMEENQRFKETMETLLKAGREQLEVISKLTGRVKSLEKKLSQKKRTHIGRRKPNHGKQTTKPVHASLP